MTASALQRSCCNWYAWDEHHRSEKDQPIHVQQSHVVPRCVVFAVDKHEFNVSIEICGIVIEPAFDLFVSQLHVSSIIYS